MVAHPSWMSETRRTAPICLYRWKYQLGGSASERLTSPGSLATSIQAARPHATATLANAPRRRNSIALRTARFMEIAQGSEPASPLTGRTGFDFISSSRGFSRGSLAWFSPGQRVPRHPPHSVQVELTRFEWFSRGAASTMSRANAGQAPPLNPTRGKPRR